MYIHIYHLLAFEARLSRISLYLRHISFSFSLPPPALWSLSFLMRSAPRLFLSFIFIRRLVSSIYLYISLFCLFLSSIYTAARGEASERRAASCVSLSIARIYTFSLVWYLHTFLVRVRIAPSSPAHTLRSLLSSRALRFSSFSPISSPASPRVRRSGVSVRRAAQSGATRRVGAEEKYAAERGHVDSLRLLALAPLWCSLVAKRDAARLRYRYMPRRY